MLILRTLIISMFLTYINQAVVIFENNPAVADSEVVPDSQKPFRSPKLKEMAETMRSMIQEAMDAIGNLDLPFSNPEAGATEQQIVVNVFLYDINDGADVLTKARSGYFNPIDQQKTDGFSTINTVSNFGNIIYLDIGFWDPTQLRTSPLSTDSPATRVKKLYGNENFFYQNFAKQLHELINYQSHNPYRDNDSNVRSGIIFEEYGWLRDALGYFTAFRSTRRSGSNELSPGRVGVGRGLTISGTDRPVFNTCGAVIDFNKGICNGVPETGRDISLQSTVFPVLRLLFHHNSFLRPEAFYLKDLPGLFYRDTGPIGLRNLISVQRTEEQELEYQNLLERHISNEDIASGLGFLTLLYAWEQLEFKQPGSGDRFIKELVKSDVQSFYVKDSLSNELIDSGKICDKTPGVKPVDKMCAINQILKNVIAVDGRTFQDYYFDMGAALFLDQASETTSNITSFQIRNFNFSDLDQLFATVDPNLTTGTRKGMNFVRVIRDVLAGSEEDEDTGDVGVVEEQPVPVAQDEAGGVENEPEEVTVEEPVQENFTLEANQVEGNVLSGTSLDLTTYSFGFVKLENKRAAISDLSFTFNDTGDLLDGKIDGKPITIKSRKLDPMESQPRFGTTTYKVARSSAQEFIATDVILFQGFAQTNVKFNDSKAAFSQARVPAYKEFIEPDLSKSSLEFRDELWSPPFDPYRTESRRAVFDTSGVKAFGSYRTIWEKRASEVDDPIAFREYTFSFKTVDFTKTTTLAQVYENRTGILKESIAGVGDGKPFVLNLWVDQVNLSPCDSLSVTNDCAEDGADLDKPPVLDEAPDPIVNLDPETETIITQSSLQVATETDQIITISGRLDKILSVKNPFDTPVKLSFHLPNGGRVSDRFTIGNQGNSSLLRLAALNTDKFKVVYRNSVRAAVQKAIEQIDQPFTIPPISTKNLLIINRGQKDDQLIVKLQKLASTSKVPDYSVATEGGGGGGCFVATASFGSMDHRVVRDLIWFRDKILLKTEFGRIAVGLYYRYSPPLAAWIELSSERRWMGMLCLLPLWLMVLIIQFIPVVGILVMLLTVFYFRLSLRDKLSI